MTTVKTNAISLQGRRAHNEKMRNKTNKPHHDNFKKFIKSEDWGQKYDGTEIKTTLYYVVKTSKKLHSVQPKKEKVLVLSLWLKIMICAVCTLRNVTF